ncbi:MAG: 23S rRNA (guanosine(2251)-2'-O)-methyltransferase RlmB [Actinomycetota bacterium]
MARAGYGDRVEGLHAVAAAATAGRVEELWVERGRLRRPEVLAVTEVVVARGGRVLEVDDIADLADSDAPQGMVARCRPIRDRALEDLVPEGRPGAVMIIDHVVDPHNVGAIARSVAAAGFDGLVTSTRRAAPLSAVTFKAAAGALETLAVVRVNSVAEALSRLQKLGLWGIGLASEGDQHLLGLGVLTEPVALVVGEEGRGISRLVRDRCDLLASIPLAGAVDSLNVSVAAALAAFEVRRARQAR